MITCITVEGDVLKGKTPVEKEGQQRHREISKQMLY